MKKPEMIGICGGSWGDSGVGKTTVANILAKKLDYYPISLTEPIKDAAKKYFDWDGIMTPETRILLDRICRMGRQISEDYWLNLTMSRIPSDVSKIVFDDLWFSNEVRMITSNNGIVIRVIKHGHESPVLPCEMIDISNDGSLAQLQSKTLLSVTEAFIFK